MSYELWIWLAKDPVRGESSIAALLPWLPELGTTTLMARKFEMADHMAPIALAHGRRAGMSVRLAHLVEAP
jgi:hypothetical protein